MTPDARRLDWVKSTYSDAGNDCVEAAFVVAEDVVLIRDTKDRSGPVLRFTRSEWAAFLKGIGDGQFGFPE